MAEAGKAYMGLGFNPAELSAMEAQAAGVGEKVASIGSKGSTRFGSAIASAARVAKFGLIGTGIAAIYAIKQAGDFQQSLNVLQATSGATAGQMRRLSAESLKLGADAKLPATSAQDAAQALTELTKAGLSVRDAMAAARPVLQLSAAAQIDNATAATLAATALNSFHLPGTRAAHVADLLAGAANASAGDITDMGQALQFAGSALHGAGQTIDDTTVAIAEMSNAGLSGSVAGSSLAQAFRSLQAPTAKSRAEMQRLGLSFYDAQGKMLPMRGIIAQVSDKLGGLTQKQQNQTLATLFGSRAVQAARIVFLGGVDAFDKLSGSVTKAGSAQRLATAQTKGFNGALQAFESQVQTTAITLGQKLLPAATNVLGALNTMVGVLGRNSGATQLAVEAIAGLSAGIITINAGYKAFQAAARAATTAQLLFDAALTANPIGIVVVGVAGLAAGLYYLSTRTQESTATFDDATRAIKGTAAAMRDAHSAALDLRGAENRVKDSHLALEQAEANLAKVGKTNSRNSLAYRTALQQVRDASYQLTVAENDRGNASKRVAKETKKAQDDVRQAQAKASAATQKADAILRPMLADTKDYNILSGRINDTLGKSAGALQKLAGTYDAAAAKVQAFNPKLAATYRALALAARASANLRIELGRLPTHKEIQIEIRTIRTETTVDHQRHQDRYISPKSNAGRQQGGKGPSAAGNYLSAGQASVVGETGRELFVPDVGGRVVSHLDVQRLQRRDPTIVHVHVNDPALRDLIRVEVDTGLNDLSSAIKAGSQR